MKKEIGIVSKAERDVIQALYERKNGLAELVGIIKADNSDLYERLIKDVADTSAAYSAWWSTMSEKYSWESVENGNWEIDFNNCKIFLVTD